MKYELLGDNILVEPFEFIEEVLPSGLVLTKLQDDEFLQRGTVIAIGPGLESEKMVVEVGDQVVYRKIKASPYRSQEGELMLMRQKIVEGIIEK